MKSPAQGIILGGTEISMLDLQWLSVPAWETPPLHARAGLHTLTETE